MELNQIQGLHKRAFFNLQHHETLRPVRGWSVRLFTYDKQRPGESVPPKKMAFLRIFVDKFYILIL